VPLLSAGLGEHLALMVASEPGGEIVIHRHGLLLVVRVGDPAVCHLFHEGLAQDPTGGGQRFSPDLRRVTLGVM